MKECAPSGMDCRVTATIAAFLCGILIRTSILLIGVALGIASMRAESLDGVWRSEGYGLVFQIQGSNLKTFEVTTSTCVADGTALRDGAVSNSREATFKTSDAHVFLSVLADQPTTRHCILRGLLQTSELTVFRNCQLFANIQLLIHRLATLRSSYEPGPRTISFLTKRQWTGMRWSRRTGARSALTRHQLPFLTFCRA